MTINPEDDIQKAINECEEGETLLLMPGTYMIHEAPKMKPGVRIDGPGASIVLYKPEDPENAIVVQLAP